MRKYFCLLLFVGIVLCSESTLITSHKEVINGSLVYFETIGVFPYSFSADVSMIVGDLLLLSEHGGCKIDHDHDHEDLGGTIVIFVSNMVCSKSVQINHAYENGALAVGFAMQRPGRDFNYFIPGVIAENFPVFSVSEDDFMRWENRTDAQIVLALNINENEFDIMYQQWWFIITKIMFIVLFSAMCIFIIWKLVQTLTVVPIFHIIPVCLVVELISSILRVLYWIDVMGSLGFYTYQGSTLLFSLTYGPSFVVHLLISLYWLDSITSSNITMLLSPSSLIILAVVSTCVFVLIFVSALIPSLSLVFYLLFLTLTLFTLVVFIFYIIAIVKLANFVTDVNLAKTSSKSKMKRASKTLIWYIISGVFCLFFIIGATFSIFTYGYATRNMMLVQVLMVCLLVMSFAKIYPTNLTKKSSSTAGKSNVSKTITTNKES